MSPAAASSDTDKTEGTVKRKRERANRPNRKYNDDYVQIGFTFSIDKEGDEVPVCFLCSGKTVLANEAMKPSKLS